MKRRSTDLHDEITEKEVKEARVPWWKAFKLFIANLPMIAKVVMLVIGVWGGTVAAPEAIRLASELTTKEAPPIPTGQVTTPDPDAPIIAWRGGVNTSLSSQASAINTNTAALEALRQEIRELEGRLAARRNQGDSTVEGLVSQGDAELRQLILSNDTRLEAIEEVVQP